MPTNLGSPPILPPAYLLLTSCFSVDHSLHDAGSIGPGNCPGSTVRERGDPCYWTVYHDPDATGLPRSGPPHMSYCRGPKSGYKMLPRNHPDRIQITFDDHRLVANAGLILPATLALHLGLPQLVQECLDLGDAPGRANTGDKMMTLVASALAGGDCIDDADALRTGEQPAPWAARSRRHPPWALPAPEENPPGSAQGHHRHGLQAGPHHLRHAAVRPSVRGCRRRVLRKPVSSKGAPRHQAACRPAGLPTGPHSRCPSSRCVPRISGRGGVKVFVGP